jgi:OOP family OmpA-OmpF porin
MARDEGKAHARFETLEACRHRACQTPCYAGAFARHPLQYRPPDGKGRLSMTFLSPNDRRRLTARTCGAALALALSAGAFAQSTAPGPQGNPGAGGSTGMRPSSGASAWDNNRYSLLPYTRSGYVGLNLGRPDFDLRCPTLYDCDDPDWRAHVYTGGLINEWIGAEIGYLYEGKAQRGGGDTKAQGINLALVLRAPIGAFNVFGKVGGIYGQTRVSADLLSGLETGKEDGWGASYALGVGYDFTPQAGVVLEWERNQYRFRGTGRENVDSTNLGLVYRF